MPIESHIHPLRGRRRQLVRRNTLSIERKPGRKSWQSMQEFETWVEAFKSYEFWRKPMDRAEADFPQGHKIRRQVDKALGEASRKYDELLSELSRTA